jgi:hypothetical protein
MAEGRMPNLEVRGRATSMVLSCIGLSRRPSEGFALREPGGWLSSVLAETGIADSRH